MLPAGSSCLVQAIAMFLSRIIIFGGKTVTNPAFLAIIKRHHSIHALREWECEFIAGIKAKSPI
jgi:hypothetical protein